MREAAGNSGLRPNSFSKHFEISSMAFWASPGLSEAISESLTWNVVRVKYGFVWNAPGCSLVWYAICIPYAWD